jgi:hypothetical protein
MSQIVLLFGFVGFFLTFISIKKLSSKLKKGRFLIISLGVLILLTDAFVLNKLVTVDDLNLSLKVTKKNISYFGGIIEYEFTKEVNRIQFSLK